MAGAAGWEGDSDAFLGKLMGDTRRATSTVVVRSQAMCLLERISQLGPGARAAAQRRQATLRRKGADARGKPTPKHMSKGVVSAMCLLNDPNGILRC